jgi:hypothetical protein
MTDIAQGYDAKTQNRLALCMWSGPVRLKSQRPGADTSTMRSTSPLVVLLLVLAACSSAGAPGGGEVLGQLDRAKMTQVETALSNAARGEEAHMATQGSYTTDVRALGANPPADITLTVTRADATDFCIEAIHTGLDGSWHVTSTSSTAEGPC